MPCPSPDYVLCFFSFVDGCALMTQLWSAGNDLQTRNSQHPLRVSGRRRHDPLRVHHQRSRDVAALLSRLSRAHHGKTPLAPRPRSIFWLPDSGNRFRLVVFCCRWCWAISLNAVFISDYRWGTMRALRMTSLSAENCWSFRPLKSQSD